MTGSPSSTHDKNLRIAITGSLVVHALLFMLLAWMFAGDAAQRLWRQTATPPKEKEVMLLFPDQIMLPPKEEKEKEAEKEKAKKEEEPQKKEIPPPPPLKPDQYLRTTQNQTATEAPKRPAYISDRNTTAATKKAPSPDASPAETLPSTDGMKTVALEMVDREYRGGEVREDSAPPSPASTAKPETMTRPLPVAPPSILKPKDNAPAPQEEQPKQQDARPAPQMAQAPAPESKPQQPAPPPPPAPEQPQPPTEPTEKPADPAQQKVALAKPVTSPLARLLDEADKELAREDKNRLSIELKKAEAVAPQDGLPQPQPQMQAQAKVDTPPPTPQTPAPTPPARDVAQTPPEPQTKPVPKALPVMSEPLERPPPGMRDPNAYVPYTRTTKTKSTISTRGDVPSVDAIASPKGRYTRQVEGQIGKLWHRYSSFRRDTGPGRLEISFYVTKKGKVESVVIQDAKQSNVVLTEFSLRAVRDAEIPPMPAEVYPELPEFDPNRLRFDFTFTVAPR